MNEAKRERRRRYRRPPWPNSSMLLIACLISPILWLGIAAGVGLMFELLIYNTPP